MRYLKKIKQIRHCKIIPSDFPKLVFLEQMKIVFDGTKTTPNGNGAPNAMEQLPQAKNVQKIQYLKLFQSFDNTSSRSRSKPKAALHKRSDTMFGYTGYSQKTGHLEKPLHTNRS